MVPYIIEETSKGKREYNIYSRLLMDRVIMLNDVVEDVMAQDIIAQLMFLDKQNHDDITMYINSPGGIITAGLGIFDTMNLIKSDIKTVGMSQACSMGSFLLAAGTKGKRYSLPNTRIMIHQPSGGSGGQCSDIQIQAKEIQFFKDKLNNYLAEFTGQDIERVVADTDRDTFMSSEEAKAYGLIDHVV